MSYEDYVKEFDTEYADAISIRESYEAENCQFSNDSGFDLDSAVECSKSDNDEFMESMEHYSL
jgi:hypothetical protein